MREARNTKAAYAAYLTRKETRQKAVNFLGGKCVDCLETDTRVLEFDHVADKKWTIGSRLNYKWELIEEELKKCELVCANCHNIRTYERREASRIHMEDPRLSKDFCPQGHAKTPENRYSHIGRIGTICYPCKLANANKGRRRKEIK